MGLGLIKTTERVELVCSSDPAVGRESDEWVEIDEAKGAKDKGASVVTVRALNDREIMRCSTAFAEIDFDSASTESTLQLADAMSRAVALAFIRCDEGDGSTESADVVIQALKTGPLISLGSWILSASGMGADPT